MTIDLTKLKQATLVELYNLCEPETPVKKFRDHATAIARLTKLLEERAYEVFEPEPGDFDVRVSSTEVDETEDAEPTRRHGGGRKSPLLGLKLKLVRVENPKRPGTRTHIRYTMYKKVATSTEYMDACLAAGLGTRREILSDLAWDSQQGFIKLT